MKEFRFANEHTAGEVGNVITVLRRPRLWVPTSRDYPGHDDWLQRTEAEIALNQKRAMVAYQGGSPVGAIVYRRHEEDPSIVEIRNLSVSPDVSGRYIGSFLLRNTELEAVSHDYPGTDTIMADTKATNTEMIDFLQNHGFVLEDLTDLYGLGAGLDAVLTKTI